MIHPCLFHRWCDLCKRTNECVCFEASYRRRRFILRDFICFMQEGGSVDYWGKGPEFSRNGVKNIDYRILIFRSSILFLYHRINRFFLPQESGGSLSLLVVPCTVDGFDLQDKTFRNLCIQSNRQGKYKTPAYHGRATVHHDGTYTLAIHHSVHQPFPSNDDADQLFHVTAKGWRPVIVKATLCESMTSSHSVSCS